ncbi:MAG: dihydropteroate synthase [Candidatus Aegiribacteria sp.]
MGLRRLQLATDEDWLTQLRLIGADRSTWDRLEMKCRVRAFLTDPMPPAAANILKQCMLSGGADAIVARDSVSCRIESTRALIVGTPKQILSGCRSLDGQPFHLSRLSGKLQRALKGPPALPSGITAGERELDFTDGPLVMGILNVTPDSFSDGGRYLGREEAAAHARLLDSQGADIIDIGAESTRPGSLPVDPESQMERILPVIEELSGQLGSVISVDTTSSRVAKAAIQSGAAMINDISALSDPDMAGLAARSGVPLVLMHMQGTPETMQRDPRYNDVVDEVYTFLAKRVEAAVQAGVSRDSVIIDPGIGFGKRLQDNLQLISRAAEFRWLGCRVLLGHSRKSFLGALTGVEEPWKRGAGTNAVTALSSDSADIFRVHDVEDTVQVLKVAGKLRCLR